MKERPVESAGGGPRPHQVGKASIHDPKIRQPASAARGLVPKVPFRLLLSGSSGSGKTNVARWMLDKHYHRFFSDIFLLSPTAKIDPVWKDVHGLKKQNRITDPTSAALTRILRRAENNVKQSGKNRGKHVLVILDDVIAASSFINSPAFLTAFIRGRHFLVSIIIMTQSYVKVPRSSRIQASHVIFFPSQTTEIDRLYTEHGPHQCSKRQFYELVQRATAPTQSEPYPFLYINRSAPVEQRFRRNLDLPLSFEEGLRKQKKKKQKKMKKEEEEEEQTTIQDAIQR